MKRTKQTKAIALLLVLTLLSGFLFSCGQYTPPAKDPEEEGDGIKRPVLDNDPTNDFTVSLVKGGKPFVPATAIDVYWSDGYDIFVGAVGSDGVARVDGLDGDYRVVLSTTPSGYAYNPNGNKATNDNKNITIELFDLNPVVGGNTTDDLREISDTGIYSVTIHEPGQKVYFEYSPQYNGVYTVESWVSVTDDEVNPLCTELIGTRQGGYYDEIQVSAVGEVGSFTRNFIHTVKIADENIGGVGNSLSFTFSVSAEAKSGVYPVTYSFAIKRDGGFDYNRPDQIMIPRAADMSAFDFAAFNALAGGTLVGAETLFKDENGVEKPGAYVFDQSRYKLWKISEGGDGVYHVYDEEKYASTGGYGPILVVYIDKPCRFVDAPFTTIESAGNRVLTVNGYENHKQFIEGWDALISSDYYCVSECPCRQAAIAKGEVHYACDLDCAACSCRKCPEEMMGQGGYVDWCNDDGVAPVTDEIIHFLQSFSVSQRYFADGDGWAEKRGIYAYEDSQWLFACAYYAD